MAHPRSPESRKDSGAGAAPIPEALPLGRTRPLLSLLPDVYPFRDLRRQVRHLTSRPVTVPSKKRFQHVAITGSSTGKARYTSFLIPVLAHGALEAPEHASSYFVLDLKSPSLLRVFAHLYREQGRRVIFFDPWSGAETMATEPLWGANGERISLIADTLGRISPAGPAPERGNSLFFEQSRIRLLEVLIILAQQERRARCTLPAIAERVHGGVDEVHSWLESASSHTSSYAQASSALELLADVPARELRARRRSPEVESALAALEPYGPTALHLLAELRRVQEECAAGRLWEVELERVQEHARAQMEQLHQAREERLRHAQSRVREFLDFPWDTLAATVRELDTHLSAFRNPTVARAFRRSEFDIAEIVEEPVLMLIGAPAARETEGAMQIASLLTQLAAQAVFDRGMAMERALGEPEVESPSEHGVTFLLDAFAKLRLAHAPTMAAVFQGFRARLFLSYTDRKELEALYGAEAASIEDNLQHRVELRGPHTAHLASEEGEMEFEPTHYYDDPALRDLLRLERRLGRLEDGGSPNWKFWQWTEEWQPARDESPFLVRRQDEAAREIARDPFLATVEDVLEGSSESFYPLG